METLLREGTFDADVRRAVNSNFLEALNGVAYATTYWVDTVNGSNVGVDGKSRDQAFATMARALAVVQSHDRIAVLGKVREQVVAPLGVYGVTIFGADTRPRHDLAASWLPPTSPVAATPLIKIREQGWVFANLLFQPPTDAAAIHAKRREDATDPDSSHFQVLGCRFVGGYIGIQDDGGNFNYLVDDCIFQALTEAAIKCTSTGIAVPLKDTVRNSVFLQNANDILSSYSYALIEGNQFYGATTQQINTIYNAAQGDHNRVVNNYVHDVAADIDPGNGYTGSATDVWRTFSSDTADPVVTSPPA